MASLKKTLDMIQLSFVGIKEKESRQRKRKE